ncbi:hypothetical protein PoB_003704500 [Plakobranchus ocellatus]|uniref:Uncharacterized protein n=1 Tax=Plakobranchus ocellatus TaxID=259542 RepID=A0AAV4AQJ5_9GAST|nr:hypothetical protein PoB_003704500 [Plakobranchus ocellatus]
MPRRSLTIEWPTIRSSVCCPDDKEKISLSTDGPPHLQQVVLTVQKLSRKTEFRPSPHTQYGFLYNAVTTTEKGSLHENFLVSFQCKQHADQFHQVATGCKRIMLMTAGNFDFSNSNLRRLPKAGLRPGAVGTLGTRCDKSGPCFIANGVRSEFGPCRAGTDLRNELGPCCGTEDFGPCRGGPDVRSELERGADGCVGVCGSPENRGDTVNYYNSPAGGGKALGHVFTGGGNVGCRAGGAVNTDSVGKRVVPIRKKLSPYDESRDQNKEFGFGTPYKPIGRGRANISAAKGRIINTGNSGRRVYSRSQGLRRECCPRPGSYYSFEFGKSGGNMDQEIGYMKPCTSGESDMMKEKVESRRLSGETQGATIKPSEPGSRRSRDYEMKEADQRVPTESPDVASEVEKSTRSGRRDQGSIASPESIGLNEKGSAHSYHTAEDPGDANDSNDAEQQ